MGEDSSGGPLKEPVKNLKERPPQKRTLTELSKRSQTSSLMGGSLRDSHMGAQGALKELLECS